MPAHGSNPAGAGGGAGQPSARFENVIRPQDGFHCCFRAGEGLEWRESFKFMLEELKRGGICFLAAIKEKLCKALCGNEIMNLLDEMSNSSMQAIVLIIAAVLKLPRQIEAVSATVAAIVCKSGLEDLYAS
jgi:hypothetical protein